MKLNFKNILSESVIDGLNINKFDKGVLKLMNSYFKEGDNDSENLLNIIKISEILSFYDYDKLYNLYNFYKKHYNILFIDTPKIGEIDEPLNYNSESESQFIRGILMKYYWDNYGKKTFLIGDLEWEFTLPLGDIEEAIYEESDSIEIRLLGDDTIPFVSVFVGLLESKRGIGFDMITMDEGLAEYNAQYIIGKGKYEETLGSGYLSKIENPKNLKPTTIKEYFERLIYVIQMDVIAKYQWRIEEYIEWLSNNYPPQ
jgi:hypothetical protein